MASTPDPPTELVVPGLGMLVDLERPNECAFALDDIRSLEWQLRQVKMVLTEKLVEHSQIEGSKTLHFPGGTAEVRFGTTTEYDAEQIELGLRAAGMSEERLRQIVKEKTTYTVSASEARRSSINPAYAKVIDDHSRTVEQTPSVSVKRS
jgi:hypothetical protein